MSMSPRFPFFCPIWVYNLLGGPTLIQGGLPKGHVLWKQSRGHTQRYTLTIACAPLNLISKIIHHWVCWLSIAV